MNGSGNKDFTMGQFVRRLEMLRRWGACLLFVEPLLSPLSRPRLLLLSGHSSSMIWHMSKQGGDRRQATRFL